jgi:hypothetical protein
MAARKAKPEYHSLIDLSAAPDYEQRDVVSGWVGASEVAQIVEDGVAHGVRAVLAAVS